MGADQNIDWRQAAASTLEWWRDAGVDVLVGDEPFDWLVAEAPDAVTSSAVVAATPGAMPQAGVSNRLERS